MITAEVKSLCPKRVTAIPKPVTKIKAFLGMCSYCKSFIPTYAVLEVPLSAIAHGQGLQAYNKVTWTDSAEKAFTDLKLTLQTTPSLGLPNPDRPFTQAVDEKGGLLDISATPRTWWQTETCGIFLSKTTCCCRPAYLSQSCSSCREGCNGIQGLGGYSPLPLLVPHAVSMIVLKQKTSHLSAARWLRYHAILLEMPNITVKRCNVLNPATLLPTRRWWTTQVISELLVDGSVSRNSDTGANQGWFLCGNSTWYIDCTGNSTFPPINNFS